MATMMRKLVVAMLLVLMATSGSWNWAAARPLQGDQVHAGGPSGGIVLPSPTHWRGHVLSQLEGKGRRPGGCPRTNNPGAPPCPPASSRVNTDGE